MIKYLVISFIISICILPVGGIFSGINAQSINGKITGTIRDQNGAAVPTATILATNEGTGAKRRAVADSSGVYVIPELAVGMYTIKIESSGFAPSERPGVKIDVASETRLDLTLTVQALSQNVEISDTVPTLQTDSGTIAEVVNNKQVESLPINGRDFRRLTILLPGAAPRSQRGSLGSFTVNGQREKSNIFLLDGIDNNDSFRNQPSFNQGGVTGAPATLFPQEALQEFNLQTQSNAEYGRNSGAVVNIVIKSGTNSLHGSVYDYLRNDNFDARNFFETKKQEFRNNNFGGVLGGPIVRDKMFFFGGYEGQREFVFSPGTAIIPTATQIAAARALNAAAGRPENPVGVNILNLYFDPKNIADRNNPAFAARNVNNSDNFLIKVDNRISDRFSVSGRYIFGDGNQVFPLTSGFGSPLPLYQTVVPTRIQASGINFSQVLSNRIINESRIAWNRFVQTFTPLDADFDPATIGLVTGSGLKSLPTINVSGFTSLGSPNSSPRGRVSSGYQLIDNLTLSSGSHTYKFGVEYRRAVIASFNDVNARGRLVFDSLADLLAGRLSGSGTALSVGSTRRDTFTNNIGAFAQDDWKVTPKLTFNFGLRYEYLGVLREKQNLLSNFVSFSPRGLERVGSPLLPQLYDRDLNNYAPRFGFAYRLTDTTVVRGGYGIYYDTPSQDYFLLQTFSSGGPSSPALNPLAGLGVITASRNLQITPNVPIFSTGSLPSVNSLFAVDLNMRTPYIQNYNFNIQQELFGNTVFQVSYVGSRGTKLYRLRDINQARPGLYTADAAGIAARNATRPFASKFPQFNFINNLETSANSTYDSLQTFVRRRLTSGLNLYVAYTWSKSVDDASNGIYSGVRGTSFPQDSFNLRAEKAVSSFDLRHRFTFNFSYDVPLGLLPFPKIISDGWQIAGIYTGQSGLPITPFISVDNSRTGELNDRPNVIRNPNNGPKTANQWFDKDAFQKPADGTFGNAGRNSIIGPDFHTVDFSVNKTMKFTERLRMQFRAEFFNLFNRANLSLPNVEFNSSAAGRITETPDTSAGNPRLGDGGPRVIQFGLKFSF